MGKPNKQEKAIQRVSDVLSRLTDFKEKYGDLPIRVRLAGMQSLPVISGIQRHAPKNRQGEYVVIVPRYDIRGVINEMSGVNSLVRQIADVQVLFVQYARTMMQTKAILEDIQKHGGSVSRVRKPFEELYSVARDIRDIMSSLQGLDKRLTEVVQEPIMDADYAATFAHHIDDDMTDAGFAALVTDGIGEKTSVQRLAVYVEILRKINKEIANRKRRISALENRIKADAKSQEACNAKTLVKKSESILNTLFKRREYVIERFNALKKSIATTMANFSKTISGLLEESPDTRIKKGTLK